jgi:mono/diheme cytochrome c family protein
LLSTGHLGGSLTHGSDYLTISSAADQKEVTFTITDINQAAVYKDIVQYTLDKKCVQCHGADKQKGKLRLDDSTWVLTGGKNGQVVNQQEPEQSEMLRRILLELNDEKHMPPKGKDQLTEFEQAIFKWWIVSGASFNKHVAEMQPDDKTKSALNKFKAYYSEKRTDIKREEVASISKQDKLTLEKVGWVITPISNDDNHVRAVGYNLEQPLKKAIEMLSLIKEQLVELKLSSSGINDEDIASISSLTNIEKLWLDGNKLTDQSLEKISTLTNLSYLNLAFTSISKNGIVQLKKLPALKNIYLYETKVTGEDLTQLKSEWKSVKFYGKDSMTVVPTDTLFTKPAK